MRNVFVGLAAVALVMVVATSSAADPKMAPCEQSGETKTGFTKNWPDGPGYSGYECGFSWVDISSTGTELQMSDDTFEGPFDLGFDFPLYGMVFSQVYISSNGFISFGQGFSSNTNQCPALNQYGPSYFVAPLWDDLDPGDTQDPIYYQSFASCPIGSGPCFVAQWHEICRYPGGPDCVPGGTFQAVVLGDGRMVIQILDAGDLAGESSTTGIGGADLMADHSLTYACNEADSLTDQLCVAIEPVFGLYTYVVGGIAHVAGSEGTSWRSNLAVTSAASIPSDLEFALLEGGNTFTAASMIFEGAIKEWDDVTESLFNVGRDIAGSVTVRSDARLILTARTYNQTMDGTFGQFLPGLQADEGLPPSTVGRLPHLKSTADFRTNIGFVNTTGVPCTVRYQLRYANGDVLGGPVEVTVPPFGWKQVNRVFQGHGTHDIATANVDLVSGDCRAWAYASVVDNNTGDPTTIPLVWGE